MSKVLIKAPKAASYSIVIEQDFATLAEEISAIVSTDDAEKSNARIYIITDENVSSLYEAQVKETLNIQYVNTKVINTQTDESINTDIEDVISVLGELNWGANDILIALGGSLIINIAAFVCHSISNDIKLINIPTSIKAMATNSLDGIVGSFDSTNATYFPRLVYINTSCVQTLKGIDYFDGFSYIMRNAIVKNARAYEWLIDNLYEISDSDPMTVFDMIEQNVGLRKIYMEKDPLNIKGDQMLFTLGETVGDSIYEFVTENINPGEALSLGVICAAHISMKREMLSLEEYLEIRDMFVPFHLPITIDNIDIDKVTELTHNYTNHDEQGNCTILLKKLGKAVIARDVTDDEIKAALEEIYFSEDDFVVE